MSLIAEIKNIIYNALYLFFFFFVENINTEEKLSSKAHCILARRGVARLHKIEIKELVHCLYICVSRQLAVRHRFFHLENFLIFGKTVWLFHCFSQAFIDIWISHMFKMVVYHRTLHKYNWKTKCKHIHSL